MSSRGSASLPYPASHSAASFGGKGTNSIRAAHRPGRDTAGCRRVSGSFVVTSTSTRSPWPMIPSTTLSSRDRPWPACCLASAAEQLAGVLEDQEPPLGELLLVDSRMLVLLQENFHHVAGVPEEPLWVGDVVRLAPAPPFPREGAERVRLPGAGRPVPEDQLAAGRVEFAPVERSELLTDARRVVDGDVVPRRDVDPPSDGVRAVARLGPERERNRRSSVGS